MKLHYKNITSINWNLFMIYANWIHELQILFLYLKVLHTVCLTECVVFYILKMTILFIGHKYKIILNNEVFKQIYKTSCYLGNISAKHFKDMKKLRTPKGCTCLTILKLFYRNKEIIRGVCRDCLGISILVCITWY